MTSSPKTSPHSAKLLFEVSIVDAGLRQGRFNGRGVVTKAVLEGGAQEQALVDAFEADARAVADRWPRTAAMLRVLANEYRAMAAHSDVDTELRHDLSD